MELTMLESLANASCLSVGTILKLHLIKYNCKND
jgi:hypothetical protein